MAAFARTLKRGWRKAIGQVDGSRLRDTAAWLVSLVIHLTALVALASCTLWLPRANRVLLSALPLDDRSELLPEEFHFSPLLEKEVGMVGTGTLASARAVAPNEADHSQLVYDLAPTTPVADLQVIEFDRKIFESPNVSEEFLVKGAGSVGTSGAAGAIDRLTHEILLSLDQRPTLVVWLFDQSKSLAAQRETIAKRFDRIYDELGLIEAAGNAAFQQHREQPLLTAVAAFGQGVQLITPKPIDDLSEIKASVRAIQDDVAGKGRENVFQSVGFLAEKYRRLRQATPRRNVMIVVFTDEAGDDVEHLDTAVDLCRRHEIPVYVVGVPAPFGRELAYVDYVDPDPNYDQSPQRQNVHQGPETLLPERVKLLFGRREAYEEQLDSGFGPFGLCRLAFETGGLYFTVHPNREVGRRIQPWETAALTTHLAAFFDPRIMRNYRPDYVSARQYREIVASNRARAALVQASQMPWITVDRLRTQFPKIDDGQFARILSEAQRDVAKAGPEVNQLVAILRQGEADREKLTTPRWQAGFDLAIGQALAFKARTEGYNAMLAVAKQGMKFQNQRNDTWELRGIDAVNLSTALQKDAQTARAYLQRVVDEHAGTPWAVDAARELEVPMGWEWRERFSNVAGRLAQANNGLPRPQPAAPPAKPRRPPPDL